MSRAALVLLVVLLSACRPAPPAGPPAPDADVRLTPVAALDAPPEGVTVPRGATAVRLHLAGLDRPADDLVAELEQVGGDQVRRWPVIAVADGGATTHLAVDVPGYEVNPGVHRLTVWVGDADVVARYAFRVAAP